MLASSSKKSDQATSSTHESRAVELPHPASTEISNGDDETTRVLASSLPPKEQMRNLEQVGNKGPSDNGIPTTIEDAPHPLDLDEEPIPKEGSSGIDTPVESMQAPLKPSDGMVLNPSSLPHEDIDQLPSKVDTSPLGSKISPPFLGPDTEDPATLETNINHSRKSPELGSGGTPTPTKTPTTSQLQEDLEMLNLRLEIGIGDHAELKASPNLIMRSFSNQTIPPSTPRRDNFSEGSEFDSTDDLESPDMTRSADLGHMEGVSLDAPLVTHSGLIYVPTPGVDTENHYITSGVNGETTEFIRKDATLELDTPIAMPLHIQEHGPNTETMGGEPIIVDVRTGVPLLELPAGERNTPAILEARVQMDRQASTQPEPPTTPRFELESEPSEVRTPTITTTRTVLLPADNSRLDFVDDARSVHSVATSVAPIAPNSPRFITPLLTPSLDQVDFPSYEVCLAMRFLAVAERAQQTGRSPSHSHTPSSQPVTGKAIEGAPEHMGEQDMAPELTGLLLEEIPCLSHITPEALNTSFLQEADESSQRRVKNPEISVS